jgi:hypothetical protein
VHFFFCWQIWKLASMIVFPIIIGIVSPPFFFVFLRLTQRPSRFRFYSVRWQRTLEYMWVLITTGGAALISISRGHWSSDWNRLFNSGRSQL